MKKFLVNGIIIIAVAALVFYFNTRKSTEEGDSQDITLVDKDIVYPGGESSQNSNQTTNSKSTIGEASKQTLLFNAPVGVKYVLSSAPQLLQDKSLSFAKNADEVVLGLDHPNGVRVLAKANGVAQNLINDIPDGVFFDSYGDLMPENSVQVTLLDLEDKGVENIILSIGKPSGAVDTSIFRLTNSTSEPFQYIGTIQGAEDTQFDGSRIIANRSGSVKKYKIENQVLVELN